MDVTPGSWTLHCLTPHPLDSPWSSFFNSKKIWGQLKIYILSVQERSGTTDVAVTVLWVSRKGSLSVAPSQALQDVLMTKILRTKCNTPPGSPESSRCSPECAPYWKVLGSQCRVVAFPQDTTSHWPLSPDHFARSTAGRDVGQM